MRRTPAASAAMRKFSAMARSRATQSGPSPMLCTRNTATSIPAIASVRSPAMSARTSSTSCAPLGRVELPGIAHEAAHLVTVGQQLRDEPTADVARRAGDQDPRGRGRTSMFVLVHPEGLPAPSASTPAAGRRPYTPRVITVEEFAAEARDWLDAHRADAPPDYGPILPSHLADAGRAWQATLHAAGFAGIHWPTEFGGRGLTVEHTAAWTTACAQAEVPPFLNMVGCVLTAGALFGFGTPEQQREHLEPIITGERVWCQLFSEPDAGSDLASLQTARRARRRPVDRHRSEGLVLERSGRRPRHPDGADRRRRRAPPRHLVLPARHARARCRDPTAAPDERRCRVRRGVPRRGRHCPPTRSSVPSTRVGASRCRRSPTSAATSAAPGVGLQRRLDAMLASGDDLDALGRQELTALWSRGTALWAMGQRQGPVASLLSSIAKLGIDRAALRHRELPGRGRRRRRDAGRTRERRPAVRARGADRRRDESDPAQHHRRAHPRPPQGAQAPPDPALARISHPFSPS